MSYGPTFTCRLREPDALVRHAISNYLSIPCFLKTQFTTLWAPGVRHCPDRASRHREVLLDLEHYEELAVDQTDETLDKPPAFTLSDGSNVLLGRRVQSRKAAEENFSAKFREGSFRSSSDTSSHLGVIYEANDSVLLS